MATKITVNDKVYDSVDAMPPDVRAIYEQAMRAASAVAPVVKHSEIKMTFQMTGPHFKFRVGSGATPGAETPSVPPVLLAHGESDTGAPKPIEPASGNVGLQIALVVLVGLAVGLAFWYWASVR